MIHGNFNQNIVRLDANNDVSNELEYKQFCSVANSKAGVRDFANPENNTNLGNSSNSNDSQRDDIINKIEYQQPQLSNKHRTFMLYKKETMINEVDELINKYKLLKKEIDIFGNDDTVSTRIYKQLKIQLANNFMIQVLKYIKKYRTETNPNPYFIEQLIDIVM
jgi:hypothetical protein